MECLYLCNLCIYTGSNLCITIFFISFLYQKRVGIFAWLIGYLFNFNYYTIILPHPCNFCMVYTIINFLQTVFCN